MWESSGDMGKPFHLGETIQDLVIYKGGLTVQHNKLILAGRPLEYEVFLPARDDPGTQKNLEEGLGMNRQKLVVP